MATAKELLAIAQTHEQTGRLAEALEILEAIAKAIPAHVLIQQRVAHVAGKLGRTQRAMAAYRQILAIATSPMDAAQAAVGLADALFETNPEEALALLRAEMTPDHPAEFVERQKTLVRLAEWKARRERGLPVHHALSFDEMPFAFARDEVPAYVTGAARLSALHPTVPDATLMLLGAKAVAGDFAEANALAQAFARQAPGDQRGLMRFEETAPPPRFTLPPVAMVRDVAHGAPALMISCDAAYLRDFGLPQLRSLAAVAPGADVHVHLMADTAAPLSVLDGLDLTVSATHEDPREVIARSGMRPIDYYGAVRFVRFADLLEQTHIPLWMADADALVVRDPRPQLASNAEAALRVRAGRVEPWNHFSACLVMGTPASRAYYREVANVVLAAMPRPWWGLDQFALYSAYLAHRKAGTLPTFQLLGPETVGIDFTDAAPFWFTASFARRGLLSGTPASAEHPELVRYEQMYRRFAG